MDLKPLLFALGVTDAFVAGLADPVLVGVPDDVGRYWTSGGSARHLARSGVLIDRARGRFSRVRTSVTG